MGKLTTTIHHFLGTGYGWLMMNTTWTHLLARCCLHFPRISNDYVAFISCEYPFAKSQFISQLHRLAIGRSVALPLDAQSNPVPLCGVYSVRHAEEAALKAFSRKLFHPSDMLAILPEPRYVSQEEAVRFDPSLRSLTLVRSASDLSRMNDKK